jgi:hypothetical protein
MIEEERCGTTDLTFNNLPVCTHKMGCCGSKVLLPNTEKTDERTGLLDASSQESLLTGNQQNGYPTQGRMTAGQSESDVAYTKRLDAIVQQTAEYVHTQHVAYEYL